MFICQYRGILQVNCNGWCDFTDAQNANQVNGVYHDATDWLADKSWHYYTVTLTETNAKYTCGVLKNEWNVSGSGDGNVIGGLFSNGSDLKYICLGVTKHGTGEIMTQDSCSTILPFIIKH